MEELNTTAPQVESNEVSTPQVETPNIETKGTEIEGKEPEASQEYKPSYKYKVDHKEYEFDEWVKPVIKNAEIEKKLKEIYEKSHGLGPVKERAKLTETELERYKGEHGKLNQLYTDVIQYRDMNDLEMVFKKIGIPVENVAKWVIDYAKRQGLSPEEQKVYNENEAFKRNQFEQSRQMQEQEQRYMQLATQARAAEVDSVLARADINPIARRYDEENGQGAFWNLVKEQGVLLHHLNGEDPSAEVAVQAVIKRLGNPWRAQPQAHMQDNNSGKPLPVISNVSGKAMSPVRKAPKSIEDLRKMAHEV